MRRTRIINFHGIGEPQRALEAGEAAYWIDVDQFRHIVHRIAKHPQRSAFQITFDDGNVSDLTIAAPELQRHALAATFFMLTGRIGKAGSLDRHGLVELLAMGMRVGSHGIDHVDWSSLPQPDLDRELSDSRAELEALIGRAVKSAGIPFGRYNARVLKALRRNGYTEAYSSDRGESWEGAFPRPRTSVRSDMDIQSIEGVLSGGMPRVDQIRRWAGMTAKRYF